MGAPAWPEWGISLALFAPKAVRADYSGPNFRGARAVCGEDQRGKRGANPHQPLQTNAPNVRGAGVQTQASGLRASPPRADGTCPPLT